MGEQHHSRLLHKIAVVIMRTFGLRNRPSVCDHDYVVRSMQRDGLRAYYGVSCTECGDYKSGHHDEIPTARFP